MAKLRRISTNLEAQVDPMGKTKQFKVQLTFNFETDDGFENYVQDDGSIDLQALLLNFSKVFVSADEMNI